MGGETKEACGVVGIYNVENASEYAYLGLHALQHRGQESAGIVVSDGKSVRSRKGMGLLGSVFSSEDLLRLTGHIAIGHVRYSTAGASKPQNIQPLVVEYSEGLLAVAHNGNLVNARELRQEYESYGSIFQTSTDSEVIVHLMAKPEHVACGNNIAHCLNHVKGSYSLVFMERNRLIAARDPNGFRPLSLGRLDDGYIVASETVAFDQTGAEFIRDIEPGEMIVIDENGLHSEFFTDTKKIKSSFCMFELVYFSRPDSILFGQTVHTIRRRMGRILAREEPVDADVVCAIPDSGRSAALGFSEVLNIPYDRGFVRNHYVGRTFLAPIQSQRARAAHLKHNVIKDVVAGKRVVLVDDSLVRGTTMRSLVRHVRAAGAKEVHLRISCPPNIHPCYYGVDFPTREELIANNHSLEEMERILNVDTLRYLSEEGMVESTGMRHEDFCTACWSGQYPIPVSDDNADKFSMTQGVLVKDEVVGGYH